MQLGLGLAVYCYCTLLIIFLQCAISSATIIPVGALVAETGTNIPSDSISQRSCILFAAEKVKQAGILPSSYNMSIKPYDTQGTSQYAARAVLDAINDGAVALIGASTSATAQTAQYISQVYRMPQLGYAATSPDLSSRSEYPFFARVVPSDINQSGALAEMVNRFNWPEVSVIASDDSLGRGGANAFINFLTGYGKPVLVNVALSATNADQDSIDLAVDRLKASGARVFYINMFDTLAKKVFKSAAAKGIMGPRYVWLASGSVLKPNLFKNSTGQIDDPAYKASLNGVLGCNLWPGGGPAFDQFSADWLALDPAQYPGAGTSTFSFYVPYAYDAVFTYAHAFATMINQGMDYTNGTALLEVLGNTMFQGLTGNVTLSLGERTTAKYDIMNIVDGSNSYIKVGQWDTINGLSLSGTPAIVWPDGTTNPPIIPSVFAPVPPTYTSVEYSDSIVIVLIVLTTLLAVAIVIVAIVIGVFYKHHVVADTNIVYNLVLLAGLFFCCFMLYPFFNDPNDASCAIRPWVLLPFMFVYLVIVHKLYVILIQRFTAKDEEKKVTLRVKYHWWSLPILIGVVLALEIMYLAIWTGADRPYPQTYATFNSNEETALCQSDNHWVWISIQATYIAMLVVPGIGGSLVIWLFRVNTMWNEARYIASTILALSVWIIMFIVPAYVVRVNPKAWIGLLGFGVWSSLVIVLVLLFGSRIFFLVKSLIKKKKESEKRKVDAEWKPTVSEGGKDDMLDEL